MQSNRGCAYCKADIFVKAKVYAKPVLAPMTHEQELMDELLEMTGETYIPLQKKFCPMCGREVDKRNGQV